MSAPAIANNGPVPFSVAEGTAVSRLRRVKLNSNGTVEHAGAAEKAIGVADNDMPATGASRGRIVTVVPLNHSGAIRFVASGAIAVGAEIQGATAGKVATGAGLGYINMTSGISADGAVLTAVPAR